MTMQTKTALRERFEPALCPLTDMGTIEVTGTDAEAFLNAQLSRNVETGFPTRATLAGWHDARGRVLALAWVLWTGQCWLLLTKGTDSEGLIRRMKLFVLRDDVRLRNAAEDWDVAAVVGSTRSLTAPPFAEPGNQPGDTATDEGGTRIVRIGPRISYVLAPRGGLRAVQDGCMNGSTESAAAEEILLGLVNLVPGVAGRFTAHMLNLDRLGAVSFDKGCYPGQEIVARTQNLGAVKRRVFLFSGMLRQTPAIGSALLDTGGDSVGEVVRAATVGESEVNLLAVVRIDAAAEVLTCATDTSAPLTRETLPWDQQPVLLD